MFDGTVVRITDSLGEAGATPASMISCLLGASPQLSLVAIVPELSCNSKTGSANAPTNPLEGPIPRMASRFDAEPRMMNPPMSALSPVPTCMRVESWTSRPGAAITVTVNLCETVPPSKSVAVTVTCAVPTLFPATSNLVPLTARVTFEVSLTAEKVSGEMWAMPGMETRFATLIGFGDV